MWSGFLGSAARPWLTPGIQRASFPGFKGLSFLGTQAELHFSYMMNPHDPGPGVQSMDAIALALFRSFADFVLIRYGKTIDTDLTLTDCTFFYKMLYRVMWLVRRQKVRM